jgi:hypothetical protein
MRVDLGDRWSIELYGQWQHSADADDPAWAFEAWRSVRHG